MSNIFKWYGEWNKLYDKIKSSWINYYCAKFSLREESIF